MPGVVYVNVGFCWVESDRAVVLEVPGCSVRSSPSSSVAAAVKLTCSGPSPMVGDAVTSPISGALFSSGGGSQPVLPSTEK